MKIVTNLLPFLRHSEWQEMLCWGDDFKPLRIDKDFSVDSYAIGVCNELRQALEGLVGE